jgi:hypothetical protein
LVGWLILEAQSNERRSFAEPVLSEAEGLRMTGEGEGQDEKKGSE